MSHNLDFESEDLGALLTESRPEPDREFTDRLDRAVADGFPPEWVGESARRRPRLAAWLGRRLAGSRRVLLPAMAGLCGILFVATVVIKAGESSGPESPAGPAAETAGKQVADSGAAGGVARSEAAPERLSRSAGPAASMDSAAAPAQEKIGSTAAKGRDVARNARITLGTDPEGVQGVANQVVAVVDRYHGFVLNSEVTDGPKGRAGAEFTLRIPSGSLEKAIADLSGIADLRSRSQGLTDITAPVDSNTKRLRKAKARITVLEAELAQTADPVERQKLENRIRVQRWNVRSARSQLKRLERRIDYSPVRLSVVTSEDDSASGGPSKWGLSDALDDAGHILATAAGVAVLALAVAIPIGLVVLIALALNRAWVRRARRRVLEEN